MPGHWKLRCQFGSVEAIGASGSYHLFITPVSTLGETMQPLKGDAGRLGQKPVHFPIQEYTAIQHIVEQNQPALHCSVLMARSVVRDNPDISAGRWCQIFALL